MRFGRWSLGVVVAIVVAISAATGDRADAGAVADTLARVVAEASPVSVEVRAGERGLVIDFEI